MTRRKQIETMLLDDPDDLFLNYALALELEKEDLFEESLARHQKLFDRQPPYVPAFFMAGQMLSRLDRVAEARSILLRGIEQARQQGNDHAAAEMTEFVDSLPEE